MAQVRTFVVMGLLAALLAVFAFVALGERGSEVTDEPPRYVEPREEEPVSQVGQGGTARLALPISARPECLNPYVPGCEGAEALNGLVFEGLLTLSPESEYRPSLAEGMPSYGDGTLSLEPMTIELRVRENAAFSDGEPVTSADVKWTYGRAAELAGDGGVSALYSGFSNLEEVETEGRKTVRLVFAEPYAEWRTLLTAPVLPEHVYGKEDLASLALMEEPVGSGPFVFDEELEAGFAFAASARHWREALEFPRLDGLIVEFTGPSEAAGGLSSGRVDFGSFTMPESVPDSGGLLRSESPGNRTEVLLFNSQVLDEEVRDSLAENIDRSRVSSGAGFRPTDAVFPGANPPSDEAVWSADQNGESVSTESPLRLVYPAGGPARDAAARSVVEQLEAADVEVESERVEPKEFFAETFPSGDFDLAIMDFASPAEYAALSPFLPDDSAFAVSASLGEMDEREQYFAQTRRIMAAESALLPLYAWPDAYSWSSTLSGPQPETPRRATLWNIREWGFFK